ncbi:hypothetical protein A4A49_32012 [Nicotiana attenuata]|uniref:Uncharacterized protein n=1 Tax=Nicotiana attenuata TaxID=49451 RepID=A0A1J6J025_NICAT|nr:hypothetical protein A4A49_32012 [Nicotiana attenuata]
MDIEGSENKERNLYTTKCMKNRIFRVTGTSAGKLNHDLGASPDLRRNLAAWLVFAGKYGKTESNGRDHLSMKNHQ